MPCRFTVTYPTKYKRLRAAFPCSSLRGARVTIRIDNGLATDVQVLPYCMIKRHFRRGIDARVWTLKGCAVPLGQLVSAEQPIGFYHRTFAMNPLGLHGVQPRALGRQIAAYDPHSFERALLDLMVVFFDPTTGLFAHVPGSVIPDQNPHLLAPPIELLGAPGKELGGYSAYGSTAHQAHPRLFEVRHIEPVAGDGFGLGVIF